MTRTEGANYLDELRAAGVRIIDWHPTSKFSRRDRQRIREELTARHYDLLHLFNNRAVAAGIGAARGWTGKVVTYRGYTGNVHWYDPTAYWQHLSPRVDLITCVSAAVKESLDAQLFFDGNKTTVVPKGHDPAWYAGVEAADLHELFGIPRDRVVVTLVANARRMKGLEYLGTAIRRMPAELPLHFLFVGRGLAETELPVDLADSPYHDEEDFTFAGFRQDVLSLLAASDISILPSVQGEGLSKVLLESMFLGRATIMTDIGGNRGLGVHGQTALIVPPRDEDALVEAIVELAGDAELRNRIGREAAAYVAEHFGADRAAALLNAAYRRLLSD
jgi:glycosyltransferase involved in cell wall biosynthesis